jgi:aldehyde dehydrogenase (NAD+)
MSRSTIPAGMSSSVLERLGVAEQPHAIAIGPGTAEGAGDEVVVRSPIDGHTLARFAAASPPQVRDVVLGASAAFRSFREVPAPRRGEFVRRIGHSLREYKEALAELVALEAGKIWSEALGEVQEMIDVCDFAVGLSRQLHGVTMPSERRGHRLMEQWHPLGPVGVITAFNFPVAVWAWNAALALVCGDAVVWKPSEKTPLTALACHALAERARESMGDIPAEVLSVIVGRADVGHALAASEQVPLISATGSVRMGRAVGETVAKRLGRSLLELGGNGGMIVAPSADQELAVRSIVFAAAGTAGQRCTTLRRLIVHESRVEALTERVARTFDRLPVGDPRDPRTLVGPLIDEAAWEGMQRALWAAKAQGGRVVAGGVRVTQGVPDGGFYARPTLVAIAPGAPIVAEETFAPILYVHPYDTLETAIAIHNSVPQGLSSAILTNDVREAERFCSAAGSDCGIANVNGGTSGAEIGGAFGGEKQTGGGRESGSDSWKAYMRRMTSAINYSSELPLAQGVRFDV